MAVPIWQDDCTCAGLQQKERTDQSHISQQQALSLKKLEEARQDKIKKLVRQTFRPRNVFKFS